MISEILPNLEKTSDGDIKKILQYLQYASTEDKESEFAKKVLDKACKISAAKLREFRDLVAIDVYANLLEEKFAKKYLD